MSSIKDALVSLERDFVTASKWSKDDHLGTLEYFSKGREFLSLALKSGLDGEDIVASCWDLALTKAESTFNQFFRNESSEAWLRELNIYKDRPRGTRIIDFNLDPLYFYQILVRDKSFEGRAFVPNSEKKYADIRGGDVIRFRLQSRQFWHGDEARQLGLRIGMTMEADVGRVLFSTTAHGMYEINGIDGRFFQPHLTREDDVYNLQTVGVYMAFPNYRELISSNGFLGIEVIEPRLVNK